MQQNRSVIKLGGSLLNLPNLAEVIQEWATEERPGRNFWVVGGGDLVEAMRVLDQVHEFDQESIHWQCVRLLGETARILHSLVPSFSLLESKQELENVIARSAEPEASVEAENYIVDPNIFYAPHMDGGLPTDWSTTTDSIAALLAKFANAELVLLKSTDPPQSHTESLDSESGDSHACDLFDFAKDWASKGFTDAAFEISTKELRAVRAVNLRKWSELHFNPPK